MVSFPKSGHICWLLYILATTISCGSKEKFISSCLRDKKKMKVNLIIQFTVNFRVISIIIQCLMKVN